MAVMTHGTADCLLRELIEPLDSFAVNVNFASLTKNLHEARLVDFTGNDLRRQCQSRQQSCEVSRRPGMHPRFIENMLLNRCNFALHGSTPYNADTLLTNEVRRIIRIACPLIC